MVFFTFWHVVPRQIWQPCMLVHPFPTYIPNLRSKKQQTINVPTYVAYTPRIVAIYLHIRLLYNAHALDIHACMYINKHLLQ
jgi:hypothetical protein